MGVINDGDDGFSTGVEVSGFKDETGFAFVVGAIGIDFHGAADQTQEVVPGVEGTVDDGGDPLFGVVMDDGVFEDGFAGAGLAKDDAEAALLGVDFEDVEVALLVFEEGLVLIDAERVLANAEVGADHGGVGWKLSVGG